MIIQCKGGGSLVISECAWAPGAYLGGHNRHGSQGVILTPAELDQVMAELGRIRGTLAERAEAKEQQRQRRAAA